MSVTELECERTIIRAAQMLGYRVHGERTAWSRGKFSTPIKGDAGWPDLTLVGHGRIFCVELKRPPPTRSPTTSRHGSTRSPRQASAPGWSPSRTDNRNSSTSSPSSPRRREHHE